jgi:2-dehydropantoate 2-reductase
MTQNNPTPHALIVGAGAIGALFGWKLSQAGFDISVAARSDYERIKATGISIQSIWGNDTFIPNNLIQLTETTPKEIDFLIVCTKAIPTLKLELQIKHLVSKNTSIVLLQNGIGIEAPYRAIFPGTHIISGLAFVCATKTKPAFIEHKDYGRLVFGDSPHGLSDKTKSLIDAFISVGVPCKGSDSIQKERWKKLLWNAPFNPISVVGGGISTSDILNDTGLYKLTKQVMEEVFQLAIADGYPLHKDAIQKNIDDTKVMVPYKTSMLIDFEERRELEVDVILGNAIKLAKSYNIETPGMNYLYKSLKELS